MRRAPHENVATVLVDPRVLADVELELMALDLRVWPVSTAPICPDGPRAAFQLRRRLLMAQRGAWTAAAAAVRRAALRLSARPVPRRGRRRASWRTSPRRRAW